MLSLKAAHSDSAYAPLYCSDMGDRAELLSMGIVAIFHYTKPLNVPYLDLFTPSSP